MLAVKTFPHFSCSNFKINNTEERQLGNVLIPCRAFKGNRSFSFRTVYAGHQLLDRSAKKAVQAAVSGTNDTEVSSPSSVEDFTITSSSTDKADELKINVEVSGAKTQEIYDQVFSKMVADAQPIRGFRRAKGGKTPDIPKDMLLEILGPSRVNEQVIKKVINSAVAIYVAQEGLKVGKDLQIEESFEDLEAGFEPGAKFGFSVLVQCQKDL